MPVINPMVFYWMFVADSLRGFLVFIGFALLVLAIVLTPLLSDIDEELLSKALRWSKRMVIIGVTILAVRVFMPNTETIEKMVIAQNVTYERIEQASDVVSSVYNDIMDLFRENQTNQ